MKEFIEKPIPKNATREEERRIDTENAENGFKTIGENIPEIREIFKVQLDKAGHPYRAAAVEEIIKYLYQNRADRYEVTKDGGYLHWDYLYARTIYELADIIKAVNEEDEKAFIAAMSALPWGDSNTGDQISWNISRFAYGIMSDEARQKFDVLFLGYIARSNMGYNNPAECVEKMANLEFLPQLVEYNLEETKKIKAKKPSQPGDC